MDPMRFLVYLLDASVYIFTIRNNPAEVLTNGIRILSITAAQKEFGAANSRKTDLLLKAVINRGTVYSSLLVPFSD
ncbi:MAG: hypothetical protein RQ801_07050 [Spirochaetaceae bacterium]|nr:hypothetical protein [Spirochaetaceae bacterium]